MHVDGESFIARKRKDPKEPEFFPPSAGSKIEREGKKLLTAEL